MIPPTIGAKFEYKTRKYRVDAFLKVVERQSRDLIAVTKDPTSSFSDVLEELLFQGHQKINGERFVFCSRQEATHVSGSGIAGCIASIDNIKVTGHVSSVWDAEQLQYAIDHAKSLEGEMIF